jgi:hypothetical protein
VLTPENASAVRGFASSTLRAVNRTKIAQAIRSHAAGTAKTLALAKQASSVQTVSARVTQNRSYKRFGSATISYAISTSKKRSWIRRASAVAVGLISTFSVKPIVSLSHPGKVSVAFTTALLQVANQKPTLDVADSTPSVTIKIIFKPEN